MKMVLLIQDILKPVNFRIDRDSSKIHGITHSAAQRRGVKFNEIIDDLEEDLQKSDFIVAHNLNFDRNTLLSEFTISNRNVLVQLFESKRHICTMKESTRFCHIGSPTNGYKWPKLEELALTPTATNTLSQPILESSRLTVVVFLFFEISPNFRPKSKPGLCQSTHATFPLKILEHIFLPFFAVAIAIMASG